MASSVFREDGGWVVKWKDATGRWRKKRTRCATKTEAQGFVRALERQAERQAEGLETSPGDSPLKTFGELLDWWARLYGAKLRSKGWRFSAEKHLRPALGALPLRQVTAGAIESMLAGFDGELAPKSINTLRGLAQTMFGRAIQAGQWHGANPVLAVRRRKVPKRLPSWLTPEEVSALLPFVPERYRSLFACAVYTGLRRGELVALRKRDVDLAAGTLRVSQSWEADTTKGNAEAVLPIHPELRPHLVAAVARSPSSLLFPRANGKMFSRNVNLPKVLRRALKNAGLVEGYAHVCRRCKAKAERGELPSDATHTWQHADDTLRRCERCDMKLWPTGLPRRVRFHDVRHTTATLLLKAGATLAVVQRVMRHSDPRITADTYGHLDVTDMRAALERLSFAPASPHGPPVVRLPPGTDLGATPAATQPLAPAALPGSGPSWIRTRDQSVMSGPPGESARVAPRSTASHRRESTAVAIAPTSDRVALIRPVPVPHGPPVVRLLTVRAVAAQLAVSTATVYALVERGELAHARVSNSIRIAPADLERYLARGARR